MITNFSALALINTSTTVSLIDSLLPSAGRPESNRLTQFLDDIRFRKCQTRYQINIKIGKLFLEVLKETADAVVNARYRDFNAPVRNFGCQVTALEVTRLFFGEQEELRKEAEACAKCAVSLIESWKVLVSRSVNCVDGTTLDAFLKINLGLDVRISSAMARLVRLRMLTIVNTDVENDNSARVTDNLYFKVMRRVKPSPVQRAFALLAAGVQAEESVRSVEFLRNCAKKLPLTNDNDVLVKMLEPQGCSEVLKRALGVSSAFYSSLWRNTEIVFKAFSGVVLVKNKLTTHLFTKMPMSRVMDSLEQLSLDRRTPILVLSGYVPDEVALIQAIDEVGLLTIIQSNNSNVFELEHVYASSFGEEKQV